MLRRAPRLPLLAALMAVGAALATAAAGSGCTELRGRRKIQEGTDAYRHGRFAEAVARFKEAEAFVPEQPVLWLNEGYACRELIVPGAHTPETRDAADCALAAFKQLRALAPADPRGDRLYVQTLFDIGEYHTIERSFRLRHEKSPTDLDVILVLEQAYYRMGRWRDALAFYRRAAALRPADADAQYAVGTFIWQVLSRHGGSPELAAYDPRPRPDRPPPPAAPARDPDAVMGSERVDLADEGIRFLERAVALRPHHPDALTYIGLLYRQRSVALLDDPDAWQRSVDRAVAYAARAAERR